MRAGRLTTHVRIEQLSTLQDPAGQPVETWIPFALVWAELTPLRGREFWAARQVQSEVTHKICLRYLPGVTPAMRLLHCGRYFNILSVINVAEANDELELLCIERPLDTGTNSLGRHFS